MRMLVQVNYVTVPEGGDLELALHTAALAVTCLQVAKEAA